MILIGALFVVSEGLDATGVTTWVGQSLVQRAGGGTARLLLFLMLLSAGLTALIGLNGSVAALLPMTVVVAMRRSFPASRLLMPLAFAGSAGGLLLLTGSPVNVVISAGRRGCRGRPLRLRRVRRGRDPGGDRAPSPSCCCSGGACCPTAPATRCRRI